LNFLLKNGNILKNIIELTEITFDEVLSKFYSENKIKDGRNQVALSTIQKANEQFEKWFKIKVSPNFIDNVILPWRREARILFFTRIIYALNDIHLISSRGRSVQEACLRLKKYEEKFMKKDPKFIKRIISFHGKSFGTIYLCQSPLLKLKPHKNLRRWHPPQLIHLDGLHRMLSLSYPKKINIKEINCIVAGNKNLFQKY